MKIFNIMNDKKKSIILFTLGLAAILFQHALVKAMEHQKDRDESVIYKILTPAEWEAFQQSGNFAGSDLDKKDNFIHAAFNDQYPRLIEKFFKDVRPIVLVKIDATKLEKGILKVEANKPGGEKYPHIYGTIPYSAVISSEVMK